MKLYCARYETRNFSFEALGMTEAEALKAMHKGLATHARQYGLALDWWRKYEGDLSVHDMNLNTCYRDNHPLRADK